jgi:peptidoglycan DL-endopeptidase CwlO
VLSTTIMLGLGNVMAIPTVKAESIQQQISKANSTIATAQDNLAKVTEQINRATEAINENNNRILDTETKITEKNTEVSQLQEQIAVLQDKIEKRNDVLKQRAISFQESGSSVSYLDVVFGASSFSELVDRVSAVTSIVQADNDLISQQEEDKQALEEKQNSVQKVLNDLTTMKADLEGMQAGLAEQKAHNEEMKTQFQQTAEDGSNLLASLNAQALQSSSAAIEAGASQAKQITSGNQSSTGTGSSIVSALSSGPSVPQPSGNISTVIRAGYKYIGNSVYVFGGGRTASDVANGYFDCSGFVHWAFAQAGKSVGSSTDSLLGAGSRISASQLQPGDLVFFNTYKPNGHVGIYLGGGNFIGSQSSTGVAVANMSGGYWAQHFAGVVVRVNL